MEGQVNAKRSLLMLITASVFGGFAACNYTDGECWYYGEGSENAGASVGPGGGVIVPTGPSGSYGDAPPKEPPDAQESELKCNKDEEDADTENHEDDSAEPPSKDPQVKCSVPGSSACVTQCEAIGAYCIHHAEHPYKPPAIGDLYWCKGGKPTWTCSYKYQDGDNCTRIYPLGMMWFCLYPGGKK